MDILGLILRAIRLAFWLVCVALSVVFVLVVAWLPYILMGAV